ncbi:MAG: hemin receptor [Bergeyella sp.]|nr:hemin receptor [Bergeyella sp.]
MRKKYLAVLAFVCTLGVRAQDLSIIKNSAEVYSNSGIMGTARYNAVVGALGALGGDVSSVNINPAGLGVFVSSDFSGSYSFSNVENTNVLFSNSVGSSTQKNNFSQLGGVMSFLAARNSPWKFVNVGVNYSSSRIDDYIETGGNDNIIYKYANGNRTFGGHAYDRYGYVSKYSLGIGTNYDNRFYLGGSINLHSANIEQYDKYRLKDEAFNVNFFSNQGTPYSEISRGFSASFGVIGKVTPQFRLGAAIESPTWWSIDRTFTYYNEKNNASTYSELTNFSSPLRTTFSAAYVYKKSFSVDIDYTLGLTKPSYTTKFQDTNKDYKSFYSENYKNSSEVRVGAEYRINQLRIRGGYSYADSPYNNFPTNSYTAEGNVTNQSFSGLFVGERNTIGAGLGYDFRSFYVDAAYQNISSAYSNPIYYGASGVTVISKVNQKINTFTMTLGWKF